MIKYVDKPHPITGLPNAKLGIWLFLASEVMLFGALFSAYVLLRVDGDPHVWAESIAHLNVPLATLNTFVLIASSVTMVMAWANLKLGNMKGFRTFLGATIALSLGFMVIKGLEYGSKFAADPAVIYGIWDGLIGCVVGVGGCLVLAAITYFLKATIERVPGDYLNFATFGLIGLGLAWGVLHFLLLQVFGVESSPSWMSWPIWIFMGAGAISAFLSWWRVYEVHKAFLFIGGFCLIGVIFLWCMQLGGLMHHGTEFIYPSTNTFFACYFTMTGLHGIHVLAGVAVNAYFLFYGVKMNDTEPDRFSGRVECAGLYWHFVDLVWIFLFPVIYLIPPAV